jgi:alkanesulfonate monooxygenase SsuD/methylene tetrahydromethanopterin reductase-like flavin-dependent oxidoreductase (luciferase family)
MAVDIGIGLPNPIPGTPGETIIRWARRAEEAGFSSLATIDRIVYPSYESLIALAAAAAVTERVGLMTNVLLGPTRNPVLLAKEAASVDQISRGRLTLGLGVGSREDDFETVGLDFHTRGKRFDEDLELMHRAWRGEPMGSGNAVGPRPVRGDRIPLLFGGTSDRAIERTLRWGVGWTMGGGAPERGGPLAERVRKAWKEAGKPGEPRIVGLAYFALGEGAEDKASAYLTDYYGQYGPQIVQAMPKSADALKETVARFEGSGFDELFLDPTIADLAQLEAAADAVL